mmetsp:Transcript_11253/g.17076  ORF Transcript_11253/g.17076 Transcript_11253/m.17076 type:complete len:270 (-) Transcript_11253:84-893(-)
MENSGAKAAQSKTSDESSEDKASTEISQKSNDDAVVKYPPPIIENGFASFSIPSINSHLICSLCNGYYREPHTIPECLHTYCKSCLYMSFRSGFKNCPKCNKSLEPDPYKAVLFDRTMHEIVNKIFPHLAEQDAKDEEEFYMRRGIKRKQESKPQENKTKATDKKKPIKSTWEDSMDFQLIPDAEPVEGKGLSPLEKPLLRTSGRLKIVQLKKFLAEKLKLDVVKLEVLCNGAPVGDELSLTFIHRTRWNDSLGEDMILCYRLSEDTAL